MVSSFRINKSKSEERNSKSSPSNHILMRPNKFNDQPKNSDFKAMHGTGGSANYLAFH